jgi:hypothetical protein
LPNYSTPGSSIAAARAVIETLSTQLPTPITISGAPGDDAKHYQIRAVKRAIDEAKS